MDGSKPGECTGCLDNKPARWHIDGTESHYCVICMADVIKHTILDPGDPWPPSIEGTPIPVADYADAFNALEGVPVEVREGGQSVLRILYDGLIASYLEAGLYRNIHIVHNRLFCPHPRIEGIGRPPLLLETPTERCDKFVAERELPFEENLAHIWRTCDWCKQRVCKRCGRGESNSDGPASAHGDSLCTRTQEMIDSAVEMDPEGRGKWYQICPRCGKAAFPHKGCNQLPCACGASYCFICASEIPNTHAAGGHFVPGMPCPRNYTIGDPRASWDVPISTPASPRVQGIPPDAWNAHNFDADGYDAHILANMGQQWQLADQRIRDSFANIFTSNIVGDQSENRWYVGWMIRLAVAARQMLWMIPGGMGLEGNHADERLHCLMRRIRFTHHVLNLRFALVRLRLSQGDSFELPGGNDSFDLLEPYSRSLQFQKDAVPMDPTARDRDWIDLFNVIEDQLQVQNPTTYLLDAQTRHAAAELRRATWTRSLLEPVFQMLPIVGRYRFAVPENFTLPDSAMLRALMNELQDKLQKLRDEPGGTISFALLNRESKAVLDIATLFAYNLLEDGAEPQPTPPTIGWADQADHWSADQVFAGVWAGNLLHTIRADMNHTDRRVPDDMPGRIPELHRLLTALQATISDFDRHPDPPAGISDHHLINARRIGFDNIFTAVGEEDYQIDPGNGDLRSIFFRAYSVLNNTDEILADRQVSARSSVSSNTDNTIREDRSFIEEQCNTALEDVRQNGLYPERKFILLLLDGLRRILQRMDEPGQHSDQRNQKQFDSLYRKHRQYELDLLPADEAFSLEPAVRRIARVMARRMPEALRIAEINPAGREREENLQVLTARLREVEGLVEGLSDSTCVRGYQECLRQHEGLWLIESRRPPDMQALQDFLEALRDAQEVEDLPDILLSPLSSERAREQFRKALRRFDFNRTIVGDLKTFRRLAQIYLIVCNWAEHDL